MKYSKSCHPLYSKEWADMNIEQLANSGALQTKLLCTRKIEKGSGEVAEAHGDR